MFRTLSQWDSPFTSLVAVGAILAISLLSTGIMLKSYREGGASASPFNTCHLVCAQGAGPTHIKG